jgi:hypothetical protein
VSFFLNGPLPDLDTYDQWENVLPLIASLHPAK